MRISEINVVETREGCELRALVRCDTHWVWGDEPFGLWYAFPHECRVDLIPARGDPFLAAFLPPAMVLGEPLIIEASVSGRLLENVPTIQTIYRCWNPKLAPIDVQAPRRPEVAGRCDPSRVGLFFSMGVDSSYSLLKNVIAQPDGPNAITDLIVVEGFDVYLWERDRFPPMLEAIHKVARHFGKNVLPVTTNLREFSDRVADWLRMYHGPALASVPLALGSRFGRVHIAASQTYRVLTALGTHPLLDPLWGTESLELVHDGLEADRFDKIRLLAQSPACLENLRVCTTDQVTPDYNCGQCQKCLRTMIGLRVAGVLDHCRTLPHQIDLERLGSLTIPSWTIRQYFEALIAEMERTGADRELKHALTHRLAQAPIPEV
jgi:hypothetical protein